MIRPPLGVVLAAALAVAGVTVLVIREHSTTSPQPSVHQVAITGTVGEYPSVTALTKVEAQNAWQGRWVVTSSPLVVVAPHGGGIEPRTSELADAIAGTDHTKCLFEGLLPAGNSRLHVTSVNWDYEPCRILIKMRTHALAIHGTGQYPGKVVYIGGRDTATGAELATALRSAGFTVVQPAPSGIDGTDPRNFVNDDADLAGVQFELTYDLRLELFPTKGGPPSTKGTTFVNAVRSVYQS